MKVFVLTHFLDFNDGITQELSPIVFRSEQEAKQTLKDFVYNKDDNQGSNIRYLLETAAAVDNADGTTDFYEIFNTLVL